MIIKRIKITQYYRYNSHRDWMMSDFLFCFNGVKNIKTFYL